MLGVYNLNSTIYLFEEMDAMSSPTYEFQAAVYLNNTGVSLLTKRCYQQAMETFCDAISVIKEATPQIGQEQSILQTSMQEKILHKLHKAAQRLSNPSPCTATMVNDVAIQVISDDEGALAGATASLLKENAVSSDASATDPNILRNKTVYLVCMEPVSSQDMVDHSVEVAICLYNYGQAYSCLSELESSAPYATSLREGARQLLHIALASLTSSQTLVCREHTTCTANGHGSCSSQHALNRAVLMTAMTLRPLLLGLATEATLAHHEHVLYYKQKFRSIFPLLCTLISVEDQCKVTNAGAA